MKLSRIAAAFIAALVLSSGQTASADLMTDMLNMLKKSGGKMSKEQLMQMAEENGFSSEDNADAVIPGLYSVSDSRYEWTQGEGKEYKVLLKDKGMEIESKSNEISAFSTVEIPFDVENESFTFGVNFLGAKPDDEKRIGLMFDFADNRNYRAITIGKKMFSYIVCREGQISIVKTGLIKPNKIFANLRIERKGDKMKFFLNDIEVTTMNKVKLENAVFGAMVVGKHKANLVSYIFNMDDEREDTEQSTSDI